MTSRTKVSDWDERYRRGEHATGEPSHLLVRAVEEFAQNFFAVGTHAPRALDIACGAGRHAVFLASRGFQVTAVDASRVGVQITKERARERGLTLDARVADLERGEFEIGGDAYALVCDLYYLQRDLFAPMRAGVRPEGLFVAAIHMVDESPEAKPMNPDFLLAPGELRAWFQDWKILHYHETEGRDEDPGRPARSSAEIIARRPARSSAALARGKLN